MTAQEYRERPQRRDSTKAITATEENIRQVSAYLFLDEEQTHTACRCLVGEPMKRVLAITEWLLRHEEDDSYEPSVMLVGFAKSRGLGCFRPPQDRRGLATEQCLACGDQYPVAQIVEVGQENLTFREGDTLCRGCARRHGAA